MSVEVALAERVQCPVCFALFRGAYVCCPRDGAALAPAYDDPMIGSTFAERYIIEQLLGEGAMGRVYRARHARMSRRFAIKVMFGECSIDPKTCARFAREAEAASRLRHPNVIGVVDFGETEQGLLFLAMDLADGPDLADVIASNGPLPAERVVALMEQICEGLAHAHHRGLIHRDLKPDNIILEHGEHGELARIGDFGIAVLTGDGHEGRLTTAGLVLGTPHYMAPEQATGDAIDERTDLFALGIMLYEMLSGALPFDGTGIEVARKNLSCDPPRIVDRVPGLRVDARLEDLAFHLMQKRPSSRPQSARQVADLLRAISGRPAPSRAPTPLPFTTEATALPALLGPATPELAAPPPAVAASAPMARRRRLGLIAATATLLILGAVLALSIGGGGGDGDRNDGRPEPPVTAAAEPARSDPVAAPSSPPSSPSITAVPTSPPAPTSPAVDVPALSADPSGKPDKSRPERGRSGRREQPAPAAESAPAPANGDRSTVVVPSDRPDNPAAPAAAEPPTVASLTEQYRTLGRAVDDLVRLRGDDIGRTLKKRYLAIPFADALRKPELRSDALGRIAALRRDVVRAQP